MQQREINEVVEGHRVSTFAEERFEPGSLTEEAFIDNFIGLLTEWVAERRATKMNEVFIITVTRLILRKSFYLCWKKTNDGVLLEPLLLGTALLGFRSCNPPRLRPYKKTLGP